MIEETLVRIAVALETIAANGGTLAASPTPSTPPAAGPAAVAPLPSAVPTGPVGVPAGQGPVGGPTAIPGAPGGGALGLVPGMPGAVPAGPQAVPAGPPAGAPVQGVPTLDDIRALANDFHRAHPERASEVVGILAQAGAQKMGDIPPAWYPSVYASLKALAGVA